MDDIEIEYRKNYCIATYPPLDLSCEGATEAEARNELMTHLWAKVAHLYESEVRGDWSHQPPTIKEMMDDIVYRYYEENPRKPLVKEEKYGIVLLEVESDVPLETIAVVDRGDS